MFSVVLMSLLVATAAPSGGRAAAQATQDDPPVRVSLNHRSYEQGDRARVTVSVRDDGYLVVLHITPSGLVRVLYPLDPGDDNFVRGHESYEIRSRGDREAFRIDDRSGTGTVYAAWSAEPFRFDDYARDGHWDYRFIGDSALPNDPEQGLTNLVQHMATGHFDYDLVSYGVGQQVAYSAPASVYLTPSSCWDPWYSCGYGYPYDGYGYPYYGSSLFISFGFFGHPRYRPFYYSPYYYPYYYGYRPFYYSTYYFPRYRAPVYYRPPYVGYVPGSPYRWKPGGLGGGSTGGIGYRQRTTFVGAEPATSPLFVGSRFNQGGRTTRGVPYRVPGSWTSTTTAEGMHLRPANVRGTERRAPTSVRTESGARRQPATVSPPRSDAGRRVAPAAPAREPRGNAPVTRRRPDGVELRSAPTARTYEPPARVSEPSSRVVEPPIHAVEPGARRVPQSRVVEPPTRADRPQYEPRGRVVEPPSRVDRPQYEPRGRVVEPPNRVDRPEYQPQGRVVEPPSRADRPQYEPRGRVVEPPARVEQPRYEAPPRVERSSPPPQVERSSPPPRVERSSPPPRVERSAPAPRAERPASSGRRRP